MAKKVSQLQNEVNCPASSTNPTCFNVGQLMNLVAKNGFSYNLLKHANWVGEVNYSISLAKGGVSFCSLT